MVNKVVSIYDIRNKNIFEYTNREEMIFLDTVRYFYPGIKIYLTNEQLLIINEVIFDMMLKNGNIKDYPIFISIYISNLIYDVIYNNEKLNFELLKKKLLYLNIEFNNIEIELILSKINERFKKEIKCKILKFPLKIGAD